MSKRPTIHDVAERAGVSKSLVALVFKSDQGVSPARREKVLRAAAELGYTPNAWASALRSNSSGFVGIIVADFHNPIFTEIADLARQRLADEGIFSFVATVSQVETEGGRELDSAPIQHLLDLKPASLFIVGGLPNLKPFQTLAKDINIVVALAGARGLSNAVAVRTDDETAMRLVCEHLVQTGHSQVTYLGPQGAQVADDRRAAFLAAAEGCQLTANMVSTGAEVSERSGADAAMVALREAPAASALVCYNDNIAFGAGDAAAKQLAQDGKPIAVTGFDDTYIADFERISLTSINQDKTAIVDEVCELLTNDDLFANRRGSEVLISPTLVVRNSTLAASRS